MFYLDYIIYILLVIELCIIIDKIIITKEGFQHRGNAIIAGNGNNNLLVKPSLFKNFHLFRFIRSAYDYMSIISIVLIKYPNKYIKKLGGSMEGPLNSIADAFMKVKKQSSDNVKLFMETYIKRKKR
jgi:hypothetical protein